ncbi:MAG TPA: LysR family transcriptional regulator, partial [Rhizobium sp.]|nr:LysR family transcriptional regulator [Rhizobium sp.]
MHQESLSMKLSRQFPLNALRVFEAAARHRSFTKAGEELGMTQTAVSYQVKLLEENIGEPLFLRKPRQIVLTETAERMLPKVTDAFAVLREAVANARQSADEVLEIHSVPTFASHWLARHLGTFQLQYPQIAVRLLRGTNMTDFNREPADVAIRVG